MSRGARIAAGEIQYFKQALRPAAVVGRARGRAAAGAGPAMPLGGGAAKLGDEASNPAAPAGGNRIGDPFSSRWLTINLDGAEEHPKDDLRIQDNGPLCAIPIYMTVLELT